MGIRSWLGVVVIAVICALLLVADGTLYRPRRERLRELTRELAIAESEHAYVAGHSIELERILDLLPADVDGVNEGEQQFLSNISQRLQARDDPFFNRTSPFLSKELNSLIYGTFQHFINIFIPVTDFQYVILS